MLKILAVTAISLSALIITGSAFANSNDQFFAYHKNNNDKMQANYETREYNRLEKRRIQEERGVQRLQQHKWETGYVMPQHYRSNRYKVEYKDFDLPKPNRNQQWYKVNKDYILIDSQNNNILQIIDY